MDEGRFAPSNVTRISTLFTSEGYIMVYLSLNPQGLKGDLRQVIAEIIWDAPDGQRQMRCTLMERFTPPDFDYRAYQVDGNIMNVWDVDQKGWRAFYLDKVISCQMLNWG